MELIHAEGVEFMLSEIERVALEITRKHKIPVGRRFLIYIEVLDAENHVVQLGLQDKEAVEHFLQGIKACSPLMPVSEKREYKYLYFHKDTEELKQFTGAVLQVLSKTLNPDHGMSTENALMRVIVNLGNLLAGLAIEGAQKI